MGKVISVQMHSIPTVSSRSSGRRVDEPSLDSLDYTLADIVFRDDGMQIRPDSAGLIHVALRTVDGIVCYHVPQQLTVEFKRVRDRGNIKEITAFIIDYGDNRGEYKG